MSNTDKPEDSLATGVQATHIGPETGQTGSATMGGKSGAGVSGGETTPSEKPAALDEESEPAPEPRTFHNSGRAPSEGIEDSPDAVKRASDGDEQKSNPLGHRS